MKANDFLTSLNGISEDDFFEVFPVSGKDGYHSYFNSVRNYYITFNTEQYTQLDGEGKTVYLITNNFDYYFALRGSFNVRFIPYFEGPSKVLGKDRINLSTESDVVTVSNLDLALLYNEYGCKTQIQTLYDYCEANSLTMSRPTANNGGGSHFAAQYSSVFSDMATSFPNGRYNGTQKLEYSPKMFHLNKGNTVTPGKIFTTWTRMPLGLVNYLDNAEMWFEDAYASSEQVTFLVNQGALTLAESVSGISKFTINDTVINISVAILLNEILNSIQNIGTDFLSGINNVGEFNFGLF